MASSLSIGDLAQQVGVNVETIRYYERIGLMPPPNRTRSGRRAYDESGLRALRFLRHARDLGFSIEETRLLLRQRNADDACVHVKAIAKKRLEELRAEMRRASEIEQMLSQAVENCAGTGSAVECTVLKILERAAPR